jgi:hypothetical protein
MRDKIYNLGSSEPAATTIGMYINLGFDLISPKNQIGDFLTLQYGISTAFTEVHPFPLQRHVGRRSIQRLESSSCHSAYASVASY